MRQHEAPIEFAGELRRETELAYLVFDGIHEVWLPKRSVIWRRRVGTQGDWVFCVPGWLATAKGIV